MLVYLQDVDLASTLKGRLPPATKIITNPSPVIQSKPKVSKKPEIVWDEAVLAIDDNQFELFCDDDLPDSLKEFVNIDDDDENLFVGQVQAEIICEAEDG